MQLNALNTRKCWVKTFLVLWVLLFTGCSWLTEPSLETMDEARKEKQAISSFNNWHVAFDLKTRGLADNPGTHAFGIDWSQSQEDSYITIDDKIKIVDTPKGVQMHGVPDESMRLIKSTTDKDKVLARIPWISLPTTELTYWLRGLENPKAGGGLFSYGNNARPLHFFSSGMEIKFLSYARYNGFLLPKRIKIIIGKLGITHEILINSWQFPEAGERKRP